jgi:hypothetical protein
MTLSCCDEKPASNALKMCAFEGTALPVGAYVNVFVVVPSP